MPCRLASARADCTGSVSSGKQKQPASQPCAKGIGGSPAGAVILRHGFGPLSLRAALSPSSLRAAGLAARAPEAAQASALAPLRARPAHRPQLLDAHGRGRFALPPAL